MLECQDMFVNTYNFDEDTYYYTIWLDFYTPIYIEYNIKTNRFNMLHGADLFKYRAETSVFK